MNVLAPFLLTGLLLPALERAPSARVVTVSSRLHLPGSRGEPVDFDFEDPQLEHGYNPDRAYKNSKLAALWFAYELQRRLAPRPITSNAVCPGFVPATAAASTQGAMHFVMAHLMPHMPFATSVDAATDSFVFMALDPSLDGVGGRFFGERHPIESTPSRSTSTVPSASGRSHPNSPACTDSDHPHTQRASIRKRPGRAVRTGSGDHMNARHHHVTFAPYGLAHAFRDWEQVT